MRTSLKASRFTESVIRGMTRRFLLRGDKPGVNMAQGFPDFAAPEAMKEAAVAAIRGDVNQYAITWGAKSLREAIADKTLGFAGYRPDPETEITVCCGATEGMIAAMMAVVDPGDEVLIFEPYYENYGPDAVLSGAIPRFIPLLPPDWAVDFDQLRAAITPKTRALILNTPNNPSGKVFNRAELSQIASLAIEHDLVVLTDEIYEHILYEGEHISIATLPGMRERTVTISGLSKTYSATGWRIGWLIAPPEASDAIRKVHDFLTVGAATPLQEGAAHALRFEDEYYRTLARGYLERRDFFMPVLEKCGFKPFVPAGAYYVMADFSALSNEDDVRFAYRLLNETGIATVPGSSFYSEEGLGRNIVRFAFCKKMETLATAAELLESMAQRYI
jgi:aspartate/methionine/tyrosine aminotransferase